MRRRALAACVALAVMQAPAVGHAHGGAAHVDLLTGDTSYPDGAPGSLTAALDAMVADARERGYAVKVAVVQDIYDVQRVARWLVEPQAYADHLSGLLRPGERVLTVQPAGLGGNALGEAPASALSAIQDPTDPALDALTIKAMQAVAALTRAHGTPVALPAVARAAPPGGEGDSGPPWWVVAGGPLLLVAAVGAGVALRSRQAPGDPPSNVTDTSR